MSIPRWLIAATIAFTFLILAMAVAETNLWMHFLVDRGEYVSIAGVLFIGAVGVSLHRRRRLKASLPMFIPWLLYPVVTQGDQLIDNLTIDQMRLVCHIILAIIFGAPIIVVILGINQFISKLDTRKVTTLVLLGLAAEAVVSYLFLGWYLIIALAGMGVLYAIGVARLRTSSWTFSETSAFRVMITGVIVSLGLFFGFKNRPGAYQGSPAAFMDPSQKDAVYDLERIALMKLPANRIVGIGQENSGVLASYGEALSGLVHAYWLMDRNYNYAFHNELFWRATPLVPDFRRKALDEIARMREIAQQTDRTAASLDNPSGSAPAAAVQEVREFTAFNLRRASVLEGMSDEFIKTKAGLQHATHLYEGEAKLVDVTLQAIVEKHRSALQHQRTAFLESVQKIHNMYGNRIVGF